MKMKFPETVYVVIKKDGEESYLIADEDLADLNADPGDKVGVYEKKEINTYCREEFLE